MKENSAVSGKDANIGIAKGGPQVRGATTARSSRILFVRRYTTLFTLLAVVITFFIISPSFISPTNIKYLFLQIALVGLVSCGETIVLCTGEFDISVSFVAALAGIIVAGFLRDGFGTTLAIVIALLTASLGGVLNGMMVGYLRIPAFVATLATGGIFWGATLVYAKGTNIYQNMGSGFLFIGRGYVFGLPMPVLIFIVIVCASLIIMNMTSFGRRSYAVGGNIDAARASGLNVKKIKLIAYVLCGLCCGVTGIVMTSQYAVADPLAGESFLLEAMAACFIGMSLFGEGEPNVAGTIVGVFFIGIIKNGLSIMGTDYFIQGLVVGLVLLFAVGITSYAKRRLIS